ncbi:HK97 gp10 family phage protein [Clostridium sp. BJN0001]|uniref:HK97 gp10 family phage protein n=1 Tax=Clostridium sp. BJN0001 TaxID=2930219 RepID=UPI001FD44D3E|nr:HK97 gp10 family phage protein [Clostridium sp. BJN0001]
MSNIDTSDLDDFAKNLLDYSNSEQPKKSKKFLQKEGNKLRKKTLSKAKSLTTKHTGNYYKGIKRGKVYHYKSKENNSVRVYGGSPHAHLIEYGHREVLNPTKEGDKAANIGGNNFAKAVKEGKGIGTQIGFVEGLHVFEKAGKEFGSEFNKDCEDYAEDMLKELSK